MRVFFGWTDRPDPSALDQRIRVHERQRMPRRDLLRAAVRRDRRTLRKGVTNWDAKKPVAPANKNTTEGKRCEIDADCDAYMSCVAQPNLKYRVCRRN